MYISTEQNTAITAPILNLEVALRSFVSDLIISKYPSIAEYNRALNSITLPSDHILAQKTRSKLQHHIKESAEIYKKLQKTQQAFLQKTFTESIYVSELLDLLNLFFNSVFATTNISKKFASLDDFYYSCTLYQSTRNSIAHPATKFISEIDSIKTIVFIKNVTEQIEDKYFWYKSKTEIYADLSNFNDIKSKKILRYSNIEYAKATHKNLLCREDVISSMYECIAGRPTRKRLAGSFVLYGYGGVGKTAIVVEFLRRVLRDKNDGLYPDLDFLLFFSSKDAYLRTHQTTGEIYIDTNNPEFSTCDQLEALIKKSLEISSLDEVDNKFSRGIIVIDNIENITQDERLKIINLTKNVSRKMQFIVTSRNEENCEEKAHVREFYDKSIGVSFIKGILEDNGGENFLDQNQIEQVLVASTGNALVIIQIINSIQVNSTPFDIAIRTLQSLRSQNSETIANFMFKNTFDTVIAELEAKDLPVKKVLQIFSLYGEKLELYSISKLTNISARDSDFLCNTLLNRIVLIKIGEYYEMNDFAKRYINIKLLVSKIEEAKLREQIKLHKITIQTKLAQINTILKGNKPLQRIISDWQPLNYIDKMAISDAFLIFNEAEKLCKSNDIAGYKKKLAEMDDCVIISSHPYMSFQKARILKLGLDKRILSDQDISSIANSYEIAIDSINYDYRFLSGTRSHAALLMTYGIFLYTNVDDLLRAIRMLEDAIEIIDSTKPDRTIFLCYKHYIKSLTLQKNRTGDSAYTPQITSAVEKIKKYLAQIDKNELRHTDNRFITQLNKNKF